MREEPSQSNRRRAQSRAPRSSARYDAPHSDSRRSSTRADSAPRRSHQRSSRPSQTATTHSSRSARQTQLQSERRSASRTRATSYASANASHRSKQAARHHDEYGRGGQAQDIRTYRDPHRYQQRSRSRSRNSISQQLYPHSQNGARPYIIAIIVLIILDLVLAIGLFRYSASLDEQASANMAAPSAAQTTQAAYQLADCDFHIET